MRKFWTLLPAALILASTPTLALAQKTEDGVIAYATDDAEMNAARAQAVRTLPTFFAALANPAANEQQFMLKFDLLPSPDEGEHIWADNLSVARDGTITGTLSNAPLAEGYRLGQRVTIARTAISDWSFFRGPVMQGSFTTRVMLRDMPPAQAAEIRQAFGW